MSCHVDTSVDASSVAEAIKCFQEQVGVVMKSSGLHTAIRLAYTLK